jgi:hypothetical protein
LGHFVDEWEDLPPELHHGDVSGVGVDSDDRVFLLTRREARVLVCSNQGEFLDAWGEDYFSDRPHGRWHRTGPCTASTSVMKWCSNSPPPGTTAD